jgi:hypothetical protein
MWSVYSSEDFPKWDADNGCMCDYLQALGVQVILKAGKWTHLEDFYKHVRFESWVDAAGDGRESITTGQQVAERLQGDFRLRGVRVANLDKITDVEREKIEADSKEQNLKLRRMFVDRFEQQFRTKMQGGPGRWLPNAYESECYQLLGLKPPDTVQKAETEQRAQQAPVIIHEKIDQEMLAALVAAEVAKITAPAPKR